MNECCLLVPANEPTAKHSAFDAHLQSSARVLPHGRARVEPPAPEVTWDDRSSSEILWGALREHTLIGGCMALMVGDGPNLPTIAQSIQLLWSALLGSLFLTCVQLRFTWLGASWATSPAAGVALAQRLTPISFVAIAAALVCWPCLLAARWLFLSANRTVGGATPAQARLIFGSAWSIVMLSCLALAVGAINVAGNMDETTVREDVMLGWLLALLAQWLVVEPPLLLLLALSGLVLKRCTTFDDNDTIAARAGKNGTRSRASPPGQGQGESPAPPTMKS
jgi:hypothetical protein